MSLPPNHNNSIFTASYADVLNEITVLRIVIRNMLNSVYMNNNINFNVFML